MKSKKMGFHIESIKKVINGNKINFILMSIIIFGLLLRMHAIFTNDIYTDEIYYTEVSRLSSLSSIVQLNFWLKDHAILYLLFLKISQFFTLNIDFLRLSNLILYLAVCIRLFKFFKKFKNIVFEILPVLLFSIFPYFVLINSYVSPYNFVMAFSILAFTFISDFILFSEAKNDKLKSSVLFVIFSTLAFYSDYSVIYFYLPLIPLVLILYMKSEKLAQNLTLMGLINFLLISPGLYQLFKNFHSLYGLNTGVNYANANFQGFLANFAATIFLNIAGSYSQLLLAVFLFILFVIFLRERKFELNLLTFMVLSGFIIDILFLYLFNNMYFSIFAQHIFWYFYFLLVLAITIITLYFFRYKKLLSFLIVTIIILFGFRINDVLVHSKIFGPNINYRGLTTKMLNNKNLYGRSLMVFFNNDYYYPLSKYYFKGYNVTDKTEAIEANKFFSEKTVRVINSFRATSTLSLEGNNSIAFIMFNESDNFYIDLKNSIQKYEERKRIKIINVYYRLRCLESNCGFYQAY